MSWYRENSLYDQTKITNLFSETMYKVHFKIIVLLFFGLICLESCVIDDTTPPFTPVFEYDSFDDFLKATADSTQIFSIQASQATTINGQKGTKIIIPANTFGLDGQPVEGDIQVELNELFEAKEILLLGKSTSHNNALLEMKPIHFIARQGEDVLEMLQNVEVEIPVVDGSIPVEDIFLYYGSNDQFLDNVEWNRDDATLIGLSDGNQSHTVISSHDQWLGTGHYVQSDEYKTIGLNVVGDTYLEIKGYLVFKNLNSVLALEQDGNTFVGYNVPVGEEVTIVMVGFNGYELVLGQEELTITSDYISQFIEMRVTSITAVQNFMDGL